MIIAVSDVKEHSDETLQSLLFGSRAILVRTEARVNQFIDLSAINEQIAAQLEVRPRLLSLLLRSRHAGARPFSRTFALSSHISQLHCAQSGV